uniref:Uncharacterized protein n=1 Tax=Mimiviridae sp. ChoanoV1 TaxID=2596887 RepID=A0A5B8IER5_9VIRU|nr:hypothetical protein 1_143 [Mimiviridae sp. ChoanoV1]
MLSVSKQNEINSNFIKIFKNMVEKNRIDPNILLDNFYEFEKKDIDDVKTKNIIKSMIDIPYYENNQNVNLLRKFKILKDTLHNLIDELLMLRLKNLRK